MNRVNLSMCVYNVLAELAYIVDEKRKWIEKKLVQFKLISNGLYHSNWLLL